MSAVTRIGAAVGAACMAAAVATPARADWLLPRSFGPFSRYTKSVVARLETSFDAMKRCPAGRKADFRVIVFVDGGGRLLWRRIAKSSGRKDVDAVALRAVDRAAPFPPVPIGLPSGVLWHGVCRGESSDGGGRDKGRSPSKGGAEAIEAEAAPAGAVAGRRPQFSEAQNRWILPQASSSTLVAVA